MEQKILNSSAVKAAQLALLAAAFSLCSCTREMNFSSLLNSKNAASVVPSVPVGEDFYSVHNVFTPEKSSSGIKQLDIVLIVDNSISMEDDNKKLASNLSAFVSNLQNSNLDWQACIISTDNSLNRSGVSFYWQREFLPNAYLTDIGKVLRNDQTNLQNIFMNTIKFIGAKGDGDEGGIKAGFNHVLQSVSNGCYRSGAALTYIIISDEDERSIGGDFSKAFSEYEKKFLDFDDKPENFVQNIKDKLGKDKIFTVNSIIIKPGDLACYDNQMIISDVHYGARYAELSDLTKGGIGSICDQDYSTNLNMFAQKIINSIRTLSLECEPIDSVSVNISPSISGISHSVVGKSLLFDKDIPEGHTITADYKCRK